MLTASSPKYKKDANFCPIKREGSSCSANSPRYLRMGKSMKGNKQAESLHVVEISRGPRQTHAVVQSQQKKTRTMDRCGSTAGRPHYILPPWSATIDLECSEEATRKLGRGFFVPMLLLLPQ